MAKKKILTVIVKSATFKEIESGERNKECLPNTTYNRARLIDKTYDLVCIKNGTGSDRPKLYMEYKGYAYTNDEHVVKLGKKFKYRPRS